MNEIKRRMRHFLDRITDAPACPPGPAAAVPARVVRDAQANALAGLHRRSHAARLVH